MEIPSEVGSCDGVQKRRRSLSPEVDNSESLRIPDAIIQICQEGKGVKWDNSRICYEVCDPVAFETRYKELRQNKVSKWVWNHLDKYYSLWQSGRWSRKGSCFTPKDLLETRYWQRLALALPAEAQTQTQTQTQNEKAHMHELLEAACEHRQEKLGMHKRIKTLEQDLAVAKQTCKDQEYHMTQVAAGVGPDFKHEWQAERQEWQAVREEMTRERERLEARVREVEVLEARVREVEVLEMSWKQIRGILNSKGPV